MGHLNFSPTEGPDLQGMQSIIVVATSMLACLGLFACGPQKTDLENYSSVHADSGIRGQDYESMIAQIRALADQHTDLMRVVPYGKSGQGRELIAVEFCRRSSNVKQRPLALISEGIHGNEYTNIV